MVEHIKTLKDVLDIFEPYLTTEDILEIIDEIKSEEIDMDIKIGGLYRHCKGDLYKVIAIAEHSETLEWHVVYQSLETGRFWVRPVSIWNSTRKGVQRFVFVDDEKEGE